MKLLFFLLSFPRFVVKHNRSIKRLQSSKKGYEEEEEDVNRIFNHTLSCFLVEGDFTLAREKGFDSVTNPREPNFFPSSPSLVILKDNRMFFLRNLST